MRTLMTSVYQAFAVCHHRKTPKSDSESKTTSVRVKRTKPYLSDNAVMMVLRRANVPIKYSDSRAPSAYAEAKVQNIARVKINQPEKLGFDFP